MTRDATTAAGAFAHLPQVDRLLRDERLEGAVRSFGRAAVADTIRIVLQGARSTIREGGPPPDPAAIADTVLDHLTERDRSRLRPVINATGVVLHTNLGRAPLSTAARSAVLAAAGYTNLEYELAAGRRGSRTRAIGERAAAVCGTESALVVNNGAAALLLVLATHATGREAIVSRGELIEIGGSYRLPDVMEISGAILREVGTTNRTRLEDYRSAVTDDTGVVLKVHHSNFAMIGFTESTAAGDLAALAHDRGLVFVHDLGSGLLHDETGPLEHEPSVAGAVRAGADLVVFSGDKLLGGPQAGIIAGREDLVSACSRHPLARALRIDKLQRAALEATLDAHRHSTTPVDIPVWAMLHADPADLEIRAHGLARRLGSAAAATPTAAVVGGGALPQRDLPSWGVALDVGDVDAVAAGLRQGDPPVVARVEGGRLLLDLTTVAPDDDDTLAGRVADAVGDVAAR